jgi:hypothetical protein
MTFPLAEYSYHAVPLPAQLGLQMIEMTMILMTVDVVSINWASCCIKRLLVRILILAFVDILSISKRILEYFLTYSKEQSPS